MILENEIIICTSIAPKNIDNQILAVKSWLKSGFKVISCNVREEIELIKPYFSEIEIEFEEVGYNQEPIRNKSLPYIYDIMMVIYRKTKRIGGYINSDIILTNISKDLYEFIYQETKDSLLCIQRNDIGGVGDINDLNWRFHLSGIDMFLIDKELIPEFYNDGFWVQSSWDIGLLLKAQISNVKIKELMNPIAFHIKHNVIREYENVKSPIERFWNKYFDSKENAFESAMQFYYNILFENCEQICFLDNKALKLLFVIDTESEREKNGIKEQDCLFADITIQKDDKGKEKYDYVFYVPTNTILTSVFCKTVIFIMTQYACSKLKVGKFFISLINGKYQYNYLNKNIDLLEYIHDQSMKDFLVTTKNSNADLKKIIYPIAYEILDINTDIFKKLDVNGQYYIAPAGIRAEEWYFVNAPKLKNMKFLGFLDNYKTGQNIYPMDVLRNDSKTYVIIECKFVLKEILCQIQKMKSSDKVLNAGFICYIDSKGVIYYFDLEQYKKSSYKSLNYKKEEESEKTQYS